jgi:L-threonylcarbamoyladenylate synthase
VLLDPGGLPVISPRIFRLAGADDAEEALAEAAGVIARGGIVAHPTETVYGLAVDPWNAGAVERLVSLKGRDAAAGFILIVDTVEQAEAIVGPDPGGHWRTLAGSFWPGPLTLILPAGNRAPAPAVSGEGIAIRLTSDPIARALIRAAGIPLTSTSANRTGEVPAATGEESARLFGDAIDLVLDAGPRRGAAPSTILDLTGADPRLVREGAIARDAIEARLKRVRIADPIGRRRR